MIKIDKPATMSEAEITAFQEKNKSREQVQVFEYESKVNPETPAKFYVAKPNRLQLAIIGEKRDNGDRASANDLMINTGVLAGDVDQLENDDALYFGLLRDVSELVEAKKKL